MDHSDTPPKKPKHSRDRMEKWRAMQTLKVILENGNIEDAYKALGKMQPGTKDTSVAKNAWRMITPQVIEEFRNLLALEMNIKVDKRLVDKILLMVIAQYFNGEISVRDLNTTLSLLQKGISDYKEHISVEDYTKLPESELDKRLTDLGFKPSEFKTDAS